jgi:hypothetical protein
LLRQVVVPILDISKLNLVLIEQKYTTQPRVVDREKIKLQSQVIELRSRGGSFPAIAKHLDISVGTAWNMSNCKS